jgi:hypothetical protein
MELIVTCEFLKYEIKKFIFEFMAELILKKKLNLLKF